MTDCVALALQWENNPLEVIDSFAKRSADLFQMTGRLALLVEERIVDFLPAPSQIGDIDWTTEAGKQFAAQLERSPAWQLPASFNVGDDSDWPDIQLSTRLTIRNFLDVLKRCVDVFDLIQVELPLRDIPAQLSDDCLRIIRSLESDANVIRLLQTNGSHPFNVDRIKELSAALIELIGSAVSQKTIENVLFAMISWQEESMHLHDWLEMEVTKKERKLARELSKLATVAIVDSKTGPKLPAVLAACDRGLDFDAVEESLLGKPLLLARYRFLKTLKHSVSFASASCDDSLWNKPDIERDDSYIRRGFKALQEHLSKLDCGVELIIKGKSLKLEDRPGGAASAK